MNRLKQGVAVEKEHRNTLRWVESKCHCNINDNDFYEHIAEDHIKENKNYYSKLKKAHL
jgi:hypothetical protein